MNAKLLWITRQSLQKVWFRVVLFAILAIVAVLVSPLIIKILPDTIYKKLNYVPVEELLEILSSSMLAVTTFSLSIAVSAFAAASSGATPRATILLQKDTTTQTVLATFLGAFLFGVIGLIFIKLNITGKPAQTGLFVASLVVLGLVITALLRWISHLMNFGRIGDTLNRVEDAAADAIAQRIANPYLGGNPLAYVPKNNIQKVLSNETGYIQHIDVSGLNEIAKKCNVKIYLSVIPGSFVYKTAELLIVEGANLDELQHEQLSCKFTLGNERSFEQDPRFGLLVMSEIASKALSPAVNDPGTAINVIGRLVRLLSTWQVSEEVEVKYLHLFVPCISCDDLLNDAFRAIARDGASTVEVQVRLHKALAALKKVIPEFSQAAEQIGLYALERAKNASINEQDIVLLEQALKKYES